MGVKSIMSMNLDELLAFSLIESNKHKNIRDSLREIAVETCNASKKRFKTDKLEMLRSVLSIIRFCNIHLYVCHKNKYAYYCNKLSKEILKTAHSIKKIDKGAPLSKIKKEIFDLIIQLDKIKFEEDINREFIYPREKKSAKELKDEDKKNIEEIDKCFNSLPSEENKLFEFFGI